MARKITVVVSQGQSSNPAKRKLEEDIIGALLFERNVEVTVIPHLYDLTPDGTGMLCLQGIQGDLVLMSWLFGRAARWVLDRNGIRGHEGSVLLDYPDDAEHDEDDDETEAGQGGDAKPRVIDSRAAPNRRIYCLDLRVRNEAQPFIDEIMRITRENSTQTVDLLGWIGGAPKAESLQRFIEPTRDVALAPVESPLTPVEPVRITEAPARRWYPVIDYSRCTNCMECIDFCLFGVYGVDKVETILVEQPDNCRKGCPACSRVCPENAIIFPQHKTPTIAGADVVAGSLKIDLSLLFGAPETGETAEQAAVRERDEQLQLAGRQTVGATVGLPKRQENKSEEPKDELDSLIDALDELDV